MTWQLNVYDGGSCVDIDNIQSVAVLCCALKSIQKLHLVDTPLNSLIY